jgi:hypothetical protein
MDPPEQDEMNERAEYSLGMPFLNYIIIFDANKLF